jgi:hypothetical protein
MRLAFAVALVVAMGGTDIERALTLARGRESERQQFHKRYLIDLADPVVPQIEVITEFRRLVIVAEEHVLRGDWMFTRGTRAAIDALAPTRGLITIRAQVRFNPLNTFIEPPAYALAIGTGTGAPLERIDTQQTPQYSTPFKARDGKTLSSLTGVGLEITMAASRIGQTTRTVGVMLDARDIVHTPVDFAKLD